jgi:hypothetical protein
MTAPETTEKTNIRGFTSQIEFLCNLRGNVFEAYGSPGNALESDAVQTQSRQFANLNALVNKLIGKWVRDFSLPEDLGSSHFRESERKCILILEFFKKLTAKCNKHFT